MCGIAGVIHRGDVAGIGSEMTSMLQAMKHRGPDSTGFALYSAPRTEQSFVMRFKVAEGAEARSGFAIHEQMVARKQEVDKRLAELEVELTSVGEATEYAFRYEFSFAGDLRRLASYVEDIEGVEVLSIGHALELVKDLGDATVVSDQYQLHGFSGTHAIGHTRMATESDVDIRSAHPYWAYPFSDVSVVHNGQLTNYWSMRRDLERRGHRFMSDCDSELIAVYIADAIDRGENLESAMRRSIEELDGVFTYLLATSDQLGMAKDVMAAKPMVLYEADDIVVLASEEVAIRSIFGREIDTFDPYEGEVRVWQT
jgi:methylamine---glutamate N-methyltransferase subunit A